MADNNASPYWFTTFQNDFDCDKYRKINEKYNELMGEMKRTGFFDTTPFFTEVDMSKILYSPSDPKQRYKVMVEPFRMRTVGEFARKIKHLFELKQDVVCMDDDDLIFADRETVEAIRLRSPPIRVRWKGSPAFVKPMTQTASTPLPQESSHQAFRETSISAEAEASLTTEVDSQQKTTPKVQIPFKKAFSVGEFLNNLRNNEKAEEVEGVTAESAAEEPSEDSFFLQQPIKRKRVRKHKSKKAKLNDVPMDPPPVIPAVPFTFENSPQPSHVRFSEQGEEEGEITVAPDEEIAAESATSTTIQDPVPDTSGNLDELFSLKKIHGCAPVFMRTTPAPTHSA